MESYQGQDAEANRDEECRGFLLHELNQLLEAWGLNYQARPSDLDRPVNLEAQLVDSPAAELAVSQLGRRVQKWAAKQPLRSDPEARLGWAEEGTWLLAQCRLHSLSD